MNSLYHEINRREVATRVATLRPDTSALWGRMDAPKMVVHLADSLRMAIGEMTVASKRLPIRYHLRQFGA